VNRAFIAGRLRHQRFDFGNHGRGASGLISATMAAGRAVRAVDFGRVAGRAGRGLDLEARTFDAIKRAALVDVVTAARFTSRR